MTQASGKSLSTNRRMRVLLFIQILWLVLVCVLGAWWGSLLFRQASRIAELEAATGLAPDVVADHARRTSRMLYGEGSSFFLLLFAITFVLFRIYWRDVLRVRSIQAFFAGVTHELRTPLTSIRLQAETLAESLGAEPAYRESLARLLEDTARMESQVDRTLELARVEGGGPLFLQPLQLKPWLDRLLMGWQEDYRNRIEFQAEIEDLTIEADPAALQVILRNLLENSLRHAKRDNLLVSLRLSRAARGSGRGDAVSLVFKDNGGGFKGDLRYLGIVFHRGEASPGTGVGLYLIKALMKQMGGQVLFAAESGFEVSLRFPACEGRVPGRHEARAHG